MCVFADVYSLKHKILKKENNQYEIKNNNNNSIPSGVTPFIEVPH